MARVENVLRTTKHFIDHIMFPGKIQVSMKVIYASNNDPFENMKKGTEYRHICIYIYQNWICVILFPNVNFCA